MTIMLSIIINYYVCFITVNVVIAVVVVVAFTVILVINVFTIMLFCTTVVKTIHRHNLQYAICNRTGFIKHDAGRFPYRLQSYPRFHQHTVSCSYSGTHHNRGRGCQPKRTRTRRHYRGNEEAKRKRDA